MTEDDVKTKRRRRRAPTARVPAPARVQLHRRPPLLPGPRPAGPGGGPGDGRAPGEPRPGQAEHRPPRPSQGPDQGQPRGRGGEVPRRRPRPAQAGLPPESRHSSRCRRMVVFRGLADPRLLGPPLPPWPWATSTASTSATGRLLARLCALARGRRPALPRPDLRAPPRAGPRQALGPADRHARPAPGPAPRHLRRRRGPSSPSSLAFARLGLPGVRPRASSGTRWGPARSSSAGISASAAAAAATPPPGGASAARPVSAVHVVAPAVRRRPDRQLDGRPRASSTGAASRRPPACSAGPTRSPAASSRAGSAAACIGYPTANLDTANEILPEGIYITRDGPGGTGLPVRDQHRHQPDLRAQSR
ncbi:MAG: hypothetical protein MZU95_01870 [Desulfomicrobium escambiense]|nr:hypothetical protein [Desulfomicrobium escambiense]